MVSFTCLNIPKKDYEGSKNTILEIEEEEKIGVDRYLRFKDLCEKLKVPVYSEKDLCKCFVGQLI